jgi:hypothetical protein
MSVLQEDGTGIGLFAGAIALGIGGVALASSSQRNSGRER